MKSSSFNVLYKIEIKGIYPFIKDWDNLNKSITKNILKHTSVLVKEMIIKSIEAVIYVNAGVNF